jgi:hypothetical protein
MGNLVLTGATSGSITLEPTAVAGSNTITLPANTGTLLTTGSTGQSIPKAALPTGSVLQVVQGTYSTGTTTNSTSFITTGLTASITPTSASSKILVIASVTVDTQSNNEQAYFTLFRNASNLTGINGFGNAYGASSRVIGMLVTAYLDSPSTTSSTSYTLGARSNGTNVIIFQGNTPAFITLMEIAA